jgi:hypothetical protein
MHTIRKLGTGLALAIATALVVPVAAQADTEASVTITKKHHYVYYADHDIYFAPDTKVYYWRDGERWVSGTELPEASRAYVTTGGVQIELDTDKPYEKNEWVIAHYKKHHDHDDD